MLQAIDGGRDDPNLIRVHEKALCSCGRRTTRRFRAFRNPDEWFPWCARCASTDEVLPPIRVVRPSREVAS
jgi:hypothetical protein